jgi:MFS family permease
MSFAHRARWLGAAGLAMSSGLAAGAQRAGDIGHATAVRAATAASAFLASAVAPVTSARRRAVASTARTTLVRNLAADMAMATGVGVSVSLVYALLPSIARQGGLDAFGLSLLAAAPFLANVLSVLAGRTGPHTPRGLAVARGFGGALLVVLLLDAGPLVMVLVALGFWASISFGVPLQARLWGQMYPQAARGRLIGIVGMARAASAGVGALAGGLLADRIGGLEVVAIGGLLAVGLGAFALAIRTTETRPAEPYSVRRSLSALGSRPVLRHATLAQGFLGGGIIAAAPMLALVQVDRLGLTLAEIGTLGVVAAVATTGSYVAFGALVDRRGGVVTMRVGSLFGVLGLLVYAVAPSLPVLWLAAMALGLCSAAIEMGVQGVVAEQTPLHERGAVMAGWNALTGVRGMVAPFLGTGLMAAGLLDVAGALVGAASLSAVGLVLFVRMTTGLPARSAPPALAVDPAVATSPAAAVATDAGPEPGAADQRRRGLARLPGRRALARWPRRMAPLPLHLARALTRRLAHA